jgi:hypothetical protein
MIQIRPVTSVIYRAEVVVSIGAKYAMELLIALMVRMKCLVIYSSLMNATMMNIDVGRVIVYHWLSLLILQLIVTTAAMNKMTFTLTWIMMIFNTVTKSFQICFVMIVKIPG